MAANPGQRAGQEAGQEGRIDDRIASARLREWHAHLAALDFDTAPACMDLQRWRNIVDDAHWLLECHASRLVRDGWSAAGLWGVWPANPRLGSLVARIEGARNVLFDDAGRAHWTRFGVKMTAGRCDGDALVSEGLRLVWELASTDGKPAALAC